MIGGSELIAALNSIATAIMGKRSDSGWQGIVLNSGWSNPSTSPVEYKVKDGLLRLRGNIANSSQGTTWTTAFTLPVGARPAFEVYFPVSANGTTLVQRLGRILPNGNVDFYSSTGSGIWFTLAGANGVEVVE